MNALDIIVPDFKLSGILVLYDEFGKKQEIKITKQRKMVPYNFAVTNDPQLTPHTQLNLPGDQQRALKVIMDEEKIPHIQSDLLISALGRKDYYDEILLCFAMNMPDNKNIKESHEDFVKIIKWIYLRMVKVIEQVLTLTPGTKGSKRAIYKHYFYSPNPNPQADDGILRSLVGVSLSTIDYSKLTETIKTFKDELVGLQNAEDIPIIDLVDLTLEQFNTIQKLLPADSAWIRNRKERLGFFETISNDIETLSTMAENFSNMKIKYDQYIKKYENGNISITELQSLSELVNRDEMTIRPQKIKEFMKRFNSFTLLYNASGVLRYQKKTILQSSSLIRDFLNSEFLAFLRTFRNRHKRVLEEDIRQNLATGTSEITSSPTPKRPKSEDINLTTSTSEITASPTPESKPESEDVNLVEFD